MCSWMLINGRPTIVMGTLLFRVARRRRLRGGGFGGGFHDPFDIFREVFGMGSEGRRR